MFLINEKYFYIKQFEGNILLHEKEAFGFFEVIVKCPDNIKHPLLQKRHKINGQTRTISPIGEWKYWYFSEDLRNAAKLGYTFEVLRGYLFDKEEVFTDFVEDLYQMRLKYPKNHPMNEIAKLLSKKWGVDCTRFEIQTFKPSNREVEVCILAIIHITSSL